MVFNQSVSKWWRFNIFKTIIIKTLKLIKRKKVLVISNLAEITVAGERYLFWVINRCETKNRSVFFYLCTLSVCSCYNTPRVSSWKQTIDSWLISRVPSPSLLPSTLVLELECLVLPSFPQCSKLLKVSLRTKAIKSHHIHLHYISILVFITYVVNFKMIFLGWLIKTVWLNTITIILQDLDDLTGYINENYIIDEICLVLLVRVIVF